MELVEGETLAERIARGPLSWPEARPLFAQMAEALEAAHDRGIVHRDLKPSNVKLTPEGKVKLLDFGLAKSVDEGAATAGLSESPTLSQGTALGVILGTAPYMSPEQARGQPIDKRTDIWAFGCCLYEALTGARAFDGPTVTDVLAAVVNREPDYGPLPRLPRQGRSLLERMLEKDARLRLRDVGEARIALSRDDSVEVPVPGGRSRRSLAAVALLGAAAGSVAAPMMAGSRSDLPVRRYRLPVAQGDSYWRTMTAVLSPDGGRIAYVEGGSLWIRELDALEGREIRDTRGAISPFWSPDGGEIGYFDGAGLELRAVSVATGSSRRICDVPRFSADASASWGASGSIVYSLRTRENLFAVSAQGGETRTLLPQESAGGESRYRYPQFLPDGETVLSVENESRVVALRGGEMVPVAGLPDDVSFASYSPTGHLLYQRGLRLWAVPFSADSLEVGGTPLPISERGAFPTAARDGTLLYSSPGLVQLVWVDRNGRPGAAVGKAQAAIQYPVLSPDGGRIVAMGIEDARTDLWMHDIDRGTSSPLTSDPERDMQPSWFPSGDEVAFGRGIDLLGVSADGTGRMRDLVTSGVESSVSPDGAHVAFVRIDSTKPNAPYDILVAPLDEGGEPVPLVATPASELLPSISPDGRWLAYMSDRTGRFEIYVASFPDGARTYGPISNSGGVQPKWSASGELFYVDESGLMVVPVRTTGSFSWGTPRRLFTEVEAGVRLVDRSQVPITVRYDVARDGERFVMVRDASDVGGLVVVLNFPRALAPVSR